VETLNFFGLLSACDVVIQQFLLQTYPRIAHAISPLMTVLLVLYWALYGMRIYSAYWVVDWRDIFQRIWMTVLLFSLLVWENVARPMYGYLVAIADGVSVMMMGDASHVQTLTSFWHGVGAIAAILMGDESTSFGIVLKGFGLMLMNNALFALIVAMLVMAKFGLAVTMTMLPLFALFALFALTRHWAMNCLGLMLQCALLSIFVTAIVSAGFLIFSDPMQLIRQTANSATLASLRVDQVAAMYLLEGVLLLFIWQAKYWASTLAIQGCSGIRACAQMASQQVVRR
jgi:type IV secretion system protein VirB6